MMENLRRKFCWWEEMGVVKLPLFKTWGNISCLGTLKRYYGYQKCHFLLKGRITLEMFL